MFEIDQRVQYRWRKTVKFSAKGSKGGKFQSAKPIPTLNRTLADDYDWVMGEEEAYVKHCTVIDLCMNEQQW